MKNFPVLAMSSMILINFFTSCHFIGKEQATQDAESIVSVMIDSQNQISYNDQKSEEMINLLQTKLKDFCCSFFTRQELREIAAFYSSKNGTILIKNIRRNPDNSKFREDFLNEAKSAISQETLKKMCSREFYNGFTSIINRFINNECINRNTEDE